MSHSFVISQDRYWHIWWAIYGSPNPCTCKQ